jgi:tetratricopeptide (TPR) repeat protein
MMSRLRLLVACIGFPWLVAASETSPVPAETQPTAAPAAEIGAPPPAAAQPAPPAAEQLVAPAAAQPAPPAASAEAPTLVAPPVETSPAAGIAPTDATTPPPASAPAQPAPAATATASGLRKPPEPTVEDEVSGLIRQGLQKTAEGDVDAAITAFTKMFSLESTAPQQRAALLGFARALRKKNELTKAAAVYEKLLKDYPLDEDAPDIYLELGRTQRALGAYRTAINRFYSVINSTLKLPEGGGATRYRQLAKTAQFEIAETHFQAGEYQEASRFYSRLRLLDLATADRARAHFKSAYSLFLAEDYSGAVTSLRDYLDQHPEDESVPEARYLLAVSYRRLHRPLESLVEALELLRTEKARTAKDPKLWIYWQRKTGNQIANEFYEQGDSANALTIYLTLAELSPDPAWRLPVVYQAGLCYERLGEVSQAVASYQTILDNLRGPKGDGSARPELTDLARMAAWRLDQITWQENTQQRLLLFLPPQRTVQTAPAPQHDASGNAPAAPAALR